MDSVYTVFADLQKRGEAASLAQRVKALVQQELWAIKPGTMTAANQSSISGGVIQTPLAALCKRSQGSIVGDFHRLLRADLFFSRRENHLRARGVRRL